MYEQNGFTKSSLAETALQEYREESNAARQFLDEHCHLDPSVNTLVERVFGCYQHWAKSIGHAPISPSSFGKELKKHYPQVTKKRATVGNSRPRAYAG